MGPLQVGQNQARRGALQITQGECVTQHHCPVQHGVTSGRHQLFPPAPVGVLRVATIEPIVGRIEIGPDVQSAAHHLAFEGGWQVFRDRDQRTAAHEVLQVQVGLIEGAGHPDQQPAAIG